MQDIANTSVIRTSYGINVSDDWRAGDIYPGNDNMIETIWDQIVMKGVIAEEVKKPSRKIMFIDGNDVVAVSERGNYVNHWDEHGEVSWNYSYEHGGNHWCEPMYRHNDGANVIMCDGHAEYRKKDELFFFLDGNNPDPGGTNVDWVRTDRIWCFFK